jgi:hypothetical protein
MVTTMSTVGNYIWRKDQSYSTTKTVATVQQDPGFDSGDEEKITMVGVQVKVPFMLFQVTLINLIMMKERGMNYFT